MSGIRPRARRARRSLAAAVAALASAGLLAACGGGGSGAPADSTAQPAAGAYEGPMLDPPLPTPPLRLRDAQGATVDIASYRGKAVLVTFIYANCPDICPVIVQKLKAAQTRLGARARDLRLVAVSTDPKGDTPARVTRFLRDRGMLGRMEYLVGSRTQLERVWQEWGVLSEPDASVPELINHSGYIFGISASGVRTTLYPSNTEVGWLVNDVPLLAAA
jgi:protein SCO1/2